MRGARAGPRPRRPPQRRSIAPRAGYSPYTAPIATAAYRISGASPGLAFLLGLIPGVGAIYNGQYVKGLMHVVILGVLISIVSSDEASGGFEPLFGMMIGVWVFYMAFEAYHTARKRQLGQPVDEFSSLVSLRGRPWFAFPGGARDSDRSGAAVPAEQYGHHPLQPCLFGTGRWL